MVPPTQFNTAETIAGTWNHGCAEREEIICIERNNSIIILLSYYALRFISRFYESLRALGMPYLFPLRVCLLNLPLV